MVGLLVVELCKELFGEGGVFANSSGGWGSIMGGSWGVVGGVGVFGHALSVKDAEGVLAEGSVGVLVFEGLGLFLFFQCLGFF